MGWRKSCIFSYSPIFTSPDFHFGKSPPSFNPGSYTRLDEIRNKQDSPAGRFFISTNHGETLGFDHLPSPGARGNAGYTPDYAPAPPLTQLSMTFPDPQMLSLARRHSNVYKCHLVAFGNADQQQYCRTMHLSLETVSQATLGDSGSSIYWIKFLFLFRYKVVSPLASLSNTSASKTLPTKSFLSKKAGAEISSFGWRRHKETCNTSGLA